MATKANKDQNKRSTKEQEEERKTLERKGQKRNPVLGEETPHRPNEESKQDENYGDAELHSDDAEKI